MNIVAAKPIADNVFSVKSVQPNEVFLAWRKIRKKMSKRDDTTGVNKYFIDKLIGLPETQLIVLNFINLSFAMGKVPKCLKIARVVPIPRIELASEPSHFRPISLTSNLLNAISRVS